MPDTVPPATPEAPKATVDKTVQDEAAFDAWLKDSLQKLYGDVLAEPVPERLLRIIEEDRLRKEREGKGE